MERNTRERGVAGEEAAALYLQSRGLRVVDRHFQTRWGEIDLVCQERGTWVFVEVKSRARVTTPSALDALTPAKQKKLVGAALSYMKMRRLPDQALRFDVVTLEDDLVEWIPGAFEPPAIFTY